MAKKAKRVYKKLTAAERAEYKKKLEAVEADKKDILAQGRAVLEIGRAHV